MGLYLKKLLKSAFHHQNNIWCIDTFFVLYQINYINYDKNKLGFILKKKN